MFIYLKKFNRTTVNIFLIGGAVRDKLLNSTFIEKDWLLVKSKFEFIYDFKLVGKSFPVFLHPINKEEYSLAREYGLLNQKYAKYFFKFSHSTQFKNDLLNRDLTINTIILSKNGFIIDTLNSVKDLQKKKNVMYIIFF